MAPNGGNELRSVITFHSPIRTFNRIFVENSLQDMKDAVRKKLGLSLASPIHLDHLQGEYCIALEDDDDFNAFQLLAKSMASLVVRVTVGDATDETRNDESTNTTAQFPPINSSSDDTSSAHSRKRRASISKTGSTSKKIRQVEHTGSTLEERGKRKRSAVDEENSNLKANPESNIALEPAPAADVPASPKRKKLKGSSIPAGPSDSIDGTDVLGPPKDSASVSAPKKKKKVGDSTSMGPTIVDATQNLSGQLNKESYVATSGDLHPSTKSAKPKKKGGKKSVNDTIPDRTEEAEKDSPPEASDAQVSKKKKTDKKKAIEAESLHSVSPSADPDNPETSKSSAGKPSRVPNKKNGGLAPEVLISESLSAAGKKEKKKKVQKNLLSNEGEPEETVANAYDKFFRSGQELDHEVSNQAALSSKNAKKRSTEITKADGDSTNSNRIRTKKTKQPDETSKKASTTEELEAAQATIRAAIAQNSLRRKQATVDDAVATDVGLSETASKAPSPIIVGGPSTITVPAPEPQTSSSLTSKQGKQSRQLTKTPHVNGHSGAPSCALLEGHSSSTASPAEIDVFGPVTSPASVGKRKSAPGPKNSDRKSGSSPDEGSSSRGVPLNAIISEDDEELTALIRGPKRGRLNVSQILSVVAASGDEDNGVGELEEEEEMQPKYRSFAAADASSSEDEIEDEDVPDAVPVTDRPASVPLLASSTSKERSSTSPSMRSSAADLKDTTSKDSKQHVGDGAPVPDTPGEESHTPRKPPTEPEPDSPIESFDEPQQTLQARVGSPSRPNGLLKRMKGKSASLSPQQSRLQPLMLSQKGKLDGVSEEVGPKIVSQLPSTQPPALLKPIDLDNAPKPVSPQPRRQSLDTWEILKTSSPNTDADSSLNYDELVSMNQDELTSSTPNDRRLAPQVTKRQTADSSDLHDSQPTDDPLFLPSESQRPFPYSQYQAGTDDQVDANDSDDEDEVEATVKSGPDVTASSFRRLTDIGSQRSFFSSQTPGWQKADFSRPTLQDLYGNGPEDESDSLDEDNDSGDEKTSHIPQSRRAGAK